MYILEIHSSSLSSLQQTSVCSVVYISGQVSWRHHLQFSSLKWGNDYFILPSYLLPVHYSFRRITDETASMGLKIKSFSVHGYHLRSVLTTTRTKNNNKLRWKLPTSTNSHSNKSWLSVTCLRPQFITVQSPWSFFPDHNLNRKKKSQICVSHVRRNDQNWDTSSCSVNVAWRD